MRTALLTTTAFLTVSLIGCDSKPPAKAPSAPTAGASHSSTAAAPSKEDVDAVKSFVDDKTGGKKPSAAPTGTMPPGHPPIDGSTPPPAPAASSGNLPAGHPPIGSGGGGGVGGGAGSGATELKLEAPSDWVKQTPSSGMRKAQYAIPKAEGDTEDGEVVLFFFGKGEGGPVRANIDRWKGQFTTADGKPLPDDASKEEKFESNGLQITWLDVAGRFAAGPMGGTDAGPRDNYRMFGAVIETPGGVWFVKATGPAATMAKQEENVRNYVKSASVQK